MIDKDMTKRDIRLATGASSATIAKLSRNELVSMDFLLRICGYLQCNIGDIMDVVHVGKSDATHNKIN